MDDDIFNQSDNSFDEQGFLREILQLPDFSPQSDETSSPCPYFKIQNNISVDGVTSPPNSISTLSLEETGFERNDPLHKSHSSNSIMSLENNLNSPTTYLLSFDKSSVEQITHESSPDHNSVLRSNNRTRGSELTPGMHQATKKVRRSGTPHHIMAERKRRKELTQNIIALSATIPGLKKTDKVYVLREAINYTKQLQERVKELENQNRDKNVDSATFTMKSQDSSNKSTTYCETNRESLPIGVKARVLEKEVNVGIHCEKQKDIVHNIYVLLEKIHLSVTCSSVLPFGTSLIINIIAQMDDEYNMSIDELVKNLKEYMLEACGVQ